MRSYASRIMFCCSSALSSGTTQKSTKRNSVDVCFAHYESRRFVLGFIDVSGFFAIFTLWIGVRRWGRHSLLRCVCSLRVFLLAGVRLRVFGSCVRSVWRWSFAWGGSGRVFAPFRSGFSPWVGCLVFVCVVGGCFSFFFLCSFAGMICYLVVRGVPLCWRPPCGFRFVGVCVCSRPRSCACCPPGPWLGRRVVAGGGVLFAVSSFSRLWLGLGCRSGWF